MNNVLLLQPEYCIDCHSCQLACSLKHEGTYRPSKSRIEVLTSPLKFLCRSPAFNVRTGLRCCVCGQCIDQE
jgi:Fe-S-cluster-containing hydrogenase component 2